VGTLPHSGLRGLPEDGSIGNIGRIKIGKRPYVPTFLSFLIKEILRDTFSR